MQLKRLSFILIFTLLSYINVSGGGLNPPTCQVSVTAPVNFGNINPYDYTPETTLGQIKVQCTTIQNGNKVSYRLTLPRINSNSSRVIKNGINSLSYNLYTDSGYTTILADGSNSTSRIDKTYDNFSGTVTDTYTIFARIPVQPAAVNGNYSDNLLVNLDY